MSLKEATEQTSSKEEVVAYKIHGVNVNVAPSEKKFADDLFDSLASIPTGQNAINDMKKIRRKLLFGNGVGNGRRLFRSRKQPNRHGEILGHGLYGIRVGA